MRPQNWPRLYIVAVLAFCLAAVLTSALAQDRELLRRQQWIHDNAKECCPHNRCFPVTARPSIHFWDVHGFKSVVPLGKERAWPFVETFGCAYETDKGTIRCLFRPVPEAS